ncbi:hypothetical protein M9H77_28009 [Catharanthus roseus]|uniref:Uncharacterized protein n=1 Tax=Catharanthus roseus TaxID=4058 RepID=A0ACC0AER9_CATRO|nr:hypothetical protein M9H77_28009 [Catharanthus roseus]
MLFWDSEIARDAYGPYFTGVVRKSWTLPMTRMISHNELVRKILKYRDMDPNLSNVRMTKRVSLYYKVHRMFYFNLFSINNDKEMHYPPHHAKKEIHTLVDFEHIQQQSIPITHDRNTTLPEHIITVTQMVSDEPSMLYSTVNNDDDEVNGSDGNDAVSSQSKSDDENDPEEGEFQNPLNPINLVNPVTENIVPQLESSQWFNSDSKVKPIGSFVGKTLTTLAPVAALTAHTIAGTDIEGWEPGPGHPLFAVDVHVLNPGVFRVSWGRGGTDCI